LLANILNLETIDNVGEPVNQREEAPSSSL